MHYIYIEYKKNQDDDAFLKPKRPDIVLNAKIIFERIIPILAMQGGLPGVEF